jgi:hypothetical protein
MTPPPAPERACDEIGKLCEKLNSCAPAAIKINWGDVATCTTRLKLDCVDAAKAPDTGLTFAAAQACVQAVASATCEDILYRKVAACQFKGKRMNGAGCGTDDQCQSGRCAKNDAACGVCAELAKAGNTCSAGQDEDCEPGLVCSEDRRCVLPGAAGTPCNDNQPCRFGFYCRMGSCVAEAQEPGATCQDFEGCSLLKGLFCNPNVGKCQNLGFANAGDPCWLVNNTLTLCAGGALCEVGQGATTGVCSAPGKDGDTCGAERGCIEPARCLGGRCRLDNSASCN